MGLLERRDGDEVQQLRRGVATHQAYPADAQEQITDGETVPRDGTLTLFGLFALFALHLQAHTRFGKRLYKEKHLVVQRALHAPQRENAVLLLLLRQQLHMQLLRREQQRLYAVRQCALHRSNLRADPPVHAILRVRRSLTGGKLLHQLVHVQQQLRQHVHVAHQQRRVDLRKQQLHRRLARSAVVRQLHVQLRREVSQQQSLALVCDEQSLHHQTGSL